MPAFSWQLLEDQSWNLLWIWLLFQECPWTVCWVLRYLSFLQVLRSRHCAFGFWMAISLAPRAMGPFSPSIASHRVAERISSTWHLSHLTACFCSCFWTLCCFCIHFSNDSCFYSDLCSDSWNDFFGVGHSMDFFWLENCSPKSFASTALEHSLSCCSLSSYWC